MTPGWPQLRPDIQVHESVVDVDALWDRFEVFEAIHHTQRICNPMNENQLVELLDILRPAERSSWLDVACGSGELVIRAIEQGSCSATGLDLSPWMLNAGSAESERRLPAKQRPTWILTEASKWDLEQPFDCVTCLGADWIWHGMRGTIPKLKDRVAIGGIVAYGGPRLNFGADPEYVSSEFGQLETAGDVEARMAECGLRVVERVDPGEAGWLSYLDRGRRDVLGWAERYPGPRAERWIAEQQDWAEHFERDREVVGWSVWVVEPIEA